MNGRKRGNAKCSVLKDDAELKRNHLGRWGATTFIFAIKGGHRGL